MLVARRSAYGDRLEDAGVVETVKLANKGKRDDEEEEEERPNTG